MWIQFDPIMICQYLIVRFIHIYMNYKEVLIKIAYVLLFLLNLMLNYYVATIYTVLILWGISKFVIKTLKKKFFNNSYGSYTDSLFNKIQRFLNQLLLLVAAHAWITKIDKSNQLFMMHICILISYSLGIYIIVKCMVMLTYLYTENDNQTWNYLTNFGNENDVIMFLLKNATKEEKNTVGFERASILNEKIKQKEKEELLLIKNYLGVKSKYQDVYQFGFKILVIVVTGIVAAINVKEIKSFILETYAADNFYNSICVTFLAVFIVTMLIYSFYFEREAQRTTKEFLKSVVETTIKEKEKSSTS